MYKALLILTAILFLNCENGVAQKASKESFKVSKTDAQWKAKLTDSQYQVLRKSATERPNSSPFNQNHDAGTYICAACKTPLFSSEHKYESGSGWPSFDREIKGNVSFKTEKDLGFARIEEHCANCGGHLGHVFNDGPKATTGKRHCVNGAAMEFVPAP